MFQLCSSLCFLSEHFGWDWCMRHTAMNSMKYQMILTNIVYMNTISPYLFQI